MDLSTRINISEFFQNLKQQVIRENGSKVAELLTIRATFMHALASHCEKISIKKLEVDAKRILEQPWNELISTQHITQLKQQNLCKNVVKSIKASADLPVFEKFPKAHKVTFLYYQGLLLFLDAEYSPAEEKLVAAFRMCPKSSKKNKELSLSRCLSRLQIDST
ncbi:4831_t:CDS:2 [Acaulospora colombiana]|uniref:4831_t:CDS:1 n=1 Tax=Acaulospora colombiana TaxID=27376 RepID=A0ACA9NW50_9GLOM|nr:4831_t:CDS:2 [Acaulospora colombiana]